MTDNTTSKPDAKLEPTLTQTLRSVGMGGYFVSSHYANLVFHTLDGSNQEVRDCFERHGITQEILENPGNQIEFEALYEAIFELIEKWHMKDAGLSIGTKMHISSHGTIGMAVISATTVGQAIKDAAKYYKTAINFCDLEVFYQGDTVIIEIVENYNNPALTSIVAEAMILTVQNALEFVSGKKLTCSKVIFGYPPPDYAEDYKKYFSGEIEFSGDRHQMILPKSVMEMRCITADEHIHRLAEEQLQHRLQEIRDNNMTVQHVLHLMRKSPAHMPTLEDLASLFNVSTRTMIRHFQAEGTNYRQLRDRVHTELATDALRNTDHSVEAIELDRSRQLCRTGKFQLRNWT